MVAIGIDRYFAIKSPLKNHIAKHRGKATILIVWIISMCLGSVQLFVGRVQTHIIEESVVDNLTNTSYTQKIARSTCNEDWTENHRRTYTVFNFFAVYLIPVIILGK